MPGVRRSKTLCGDETVVELATYGTIGVITMLMMMTSRINKDAGKLEHGVWAHLQQVEEMTRKLEEASSSLRGESERSCQIGVPEPQGAPRDRCERYYKSLSDAGWPEDVADGFYVIECWKHGIRPLDP